MSNTIRARLGVIVVAGLFVTALAALSGCTTLRGQDADTEQLLAKAGFQKRNADSPEQARNLASMTNDDCRPESMSPGAHTTRRPTERLSALSPSTSSWTSVTRYGESFRTEAWILRLGVLP